ncbi:MAG: hypothetical protein HRU15_10485, partial [Planctomycetes bacterium]|nr:hypothetical protein [Planctomycetota bacterium]
MGQVIRIDAALHPASQLAHVQAQSPLTSIYYSSQIFDPSCNSITVAMGIPEDIPADVGCGVFLSDADGNWIMRAAAQQLFSGPVEIEFDLLEQEYWQGSPNFYQANKYHRQLVKKMGIYFWSQSQWDGEIAIHNFKQHVTDSYSTVQSAPVLYDLQLENCQDGFAEAFCGQRWTLSYKIEPVPERPYSTEQLKTTLHIQMGDQVYRIPGFYDQSMHLSDTGNAEKAIPNATPFFRHRFRPQNSGVAEMFLHLEIAGEKTREITLPDLHISGEPWDDYVRASRKDSRFFSIGTEKDQFYWPVGINLRSINDSLSFRNLNTIRTPNRGSLSYEAYFKRLQRAGA